MEEISMARGLFCEAFVLLRVQALEENVILILRITFIRESCRGSWSDIALFLVLAEGLVCTVKEGDTHMTDKEVINFEVICLAHRGGLST